MGFLQGMPGTDRRAFMKTTQETDRFLESGSLEDFNRYLTGDYMSEYKDITDYLNRYMESHSLEVSEVIKRSLLDRYYANQILYGTKKHPGRDKLIPLCLAMHMDLEETNRALKISRAGTLYSKHKRDAIIILCINQKIYDVMRVNEALFENDEEPLATSVKN